MFMWQLVKMSDMKNSIHQEAARIKKVLWSINPAWLPRQLQRQPRPELLCPGRGIVVWTFWKMKRRSYAIV